MNYTENYQLPQWEENDRILMADFNEAMSKIDGAIAQVSAQPSYVLLKDEPMEGDYQFSLRIDLSDIDWNQWQAVCMDIWSFNSQGGTALIRVNGGGKHMSMGGSRSDEFATGRISPIEDETFNARPVRIYFLPMRDERNLVRAISMDHENLYFSYSGISFGEITSVAVATEGSAFRPGSRIAVWGLR